MQANTYKLLWTCGELSSLLEHDAGEGDEVEIGKGAGGALVVLHQPPEADGQANERWPTPTPR